MEEKLATVDRESLKRRPGILMIGSSTVGKRTLLSRLLSVDFEDASDSSSDALSYGWTINTKYYTADVSVSMAHLSEEFSIELMPMYDRLAALVMVFDISDLASFDALKYWVAHSDIQKFDILLCIGNKVDLLPGHPAHAEYRRHLQKVEESWSIPYPDMSEYGISESEGISLMGNEQTPWEIKRSCLEWCSQHNIEYIEACASNADFDKCLSVDGDSQGAERLYGALSAHMWPGMILKSGNMINEPSLPETQELSEEETDYEIEYEVLSAGSAEPWDDIDGGWISANVPITATVEGKPISYALDANQSEGESRTKSAGGELQPSTSAPNLQDETINEVIPDAHEASHGLEPDQGMHYDIEDLEQLMSEIGNMRDSLRLVPDFQRREMAAKLAMKMAAMFGDSSGDEDGLDG